MANDSDLDQNRTIRLFVGTTANLDQKLTNVPLHVVTVLGLDRETPQAAGSSG